MDCPKTILYGEPPGHKRRRARHWGRSRSDQVVLDYWDLCHSRELERMKEAYGPKDPS